MAHPITVSSEAYTRAVAHVCQSRIMSLNRNDYWMKTVTGELNVCAEFARISWHARKIRNRTQQGPQY